MGIWLVLLGVMTGSWLYLFRRSKGKYTAFTVLTMEGVRLQRISPPMLYLLEAIQVSKKFPNFFFKLGRSVRKVYGDWSSGELVLLYLAEMLSYIWLLICSGCILSLLMEGQAIGFVAGTLLAILIPTALISDLHRKVVKREQEVIMELPELLNKLMLLVGAGETVQRAMKQCLQRKKGSESHPLYRELFQMMREWESGYSFQQALEGFSRRCGIQEVSAFSTAVLLNFRRGGNDFTLALRDLSHSLWEKRKAICRTRGEQASSKLLLPMLLLFVIVLMLVGTPAFMMMSL
ncbi:type II secretion protein F [Paenibacillus sp. CAA11]|uniref:type II secretion system F family protein n=1 Tax=Paenibacillus sp. CAA11 TaxID=1532905 RepID=UPI000D35453C|nr:type II secretion system F family protein [Paenibacillus sp. CAA11]AWB43835.1 type II secretion protein F [Paenibacillus sp. CAA11]